MRIVTVLLLLAFAAPVLAGPGLNLYGFSHYPDAPDDADLNSELFGLGLQYDLRVREASRLYLEGGAFNDVYENANIHLGVGYRHRVAGPLYAGGGLYLVKTESLNDGDPIIAPMPQLSLVGGPGAITFMWNPEIEGVAHEEAFTVYATLFPFGRTAAGEGLIDHWAERRSAFEFRFDPDHGVGSLRGKQLVWRKVDPGAGGLRVGVDLDLDTYERDFGPSWEQEDRYGVNVFVERLNYVRSAGPIRAYTAYGPEIGFATLESESYFEAADETYLRERSSWSAGLRFGVGVEWTVTDGIAFTAETGWIGRYSETRETYRDNPPSETERWELSGTGALTGVVLYFD